MLLASGCGESNVEGTWEVDKAAMQEAVRSSLERRVESESFEESAETKALMARMLDGMVRSVVEGIEGSIDVRESGTFEATGKFGAMNFVKGTWSRSGDELVFDAEGDQDDAIGILTGNTLRLRPRTARDGLPDDFRLVFSRAK